MRKSPTKNSAKRKDKQPISRRNFLGKAALASAAFSIVPRFVLGGQGYRAPSDMINLGMIGTGKQGRGLMRAFLRTEEAQWLAFCDVYEAKRLLIMDAMHSYFTENEQEPKKGTALYPDFREVLARTDIDGVVIVTPDHWHASLAVRAAEAGKDIYCEKPLALTIREGRAMVDATRRNQRVFQTGSMQRSWTEFRQAVELVRNGYIGEIKQIKVNVGGPPRPCDLPEEPLPPGLNWDWWLGPNTVRTPYNNQLAPKPEDDFWANWRSYREFGGGGMTDWGAHMFDIAQWALDMDESGPEEIVPPDTDHEFLTFYYDNGVVMTHEHFDTFQGVRFIGTEGRIDVQRGKLTTSPVELAAREITSDEKRVYFSDNHYKDWLTAMRNRAKPICDVETGHRTATVCTLGNLAYQLNRPLRWKPNKEKFRGDREANKLRGRPMQEMWGVAI